MGEVRVIFQQTKTQELLEKQYRALGFISRYLDSVSPHAEMLKELREYQELSLSYSIDEIADALTALKARECPPFERMAYLNAWGIERKNPAKKKP